MQIKYKISDVRSVVFEFGKNKQNHPHAYKLAQMMEQIFEEHQEVVERLNRTNRDLKEAEKEIKRLKNNALSKSTVAVIRMDGSKTK